MGLRSINRSERGFTLIEVLLTITLVGVGLVATMRALPIALQMSEASRQSMEAQQLASEMLAELSRQPFEDPTKRRRRFGRERDEAAETRADFDDIDDYDGWTASPPQNRDGTPQTEFADYRRTVAVACVDTDDYTRLQSSGNAKRITITISRPGMPDLCVVTVRLSGVNREDREIE
jgi:MSHA pilin protein MshD